MTNSKDERVPTLFSTFFSNYTPEAEKPQASEQLIKVASGCVSCPLAGKALSSTACNTCKFASGMDIKNGTHFIKCAYVAPVEKTTKTAQIDYSFSTTTGDGYEKAKTDKTHDVIEELKFAARRVGVKLAEKHVKDFISASENLRGKNLSRAAMRYISSLRERVTPETPVKRISDEFSESLTKTFGNKTAQVEKEFNASGGSYLGRLRNPNTIFNPDALDKLANTATSDELVKKSKLDKQAHKEKVKSVYRQEVEEKFKDLPIKTNSVTPLHASSGASHNPKISKSGLSMFSEDTEFSQIPEKTAGEVMSQEKVKTAQLQKEQHKKDWNQLKAAPKTKSWLFE